MRCFELHAVQKLHGDERFAVLVVNLVDRANVRMIQCRGSLGFALEAAEGLRLFGYLVGKERQQTVRASHPQLCRRRPSPRHRASRRCDSARWFGRSLGEGLHTRRMSMVGRCSKQVKQLELGVTG